ncbi:hypothetical protein EDC04DRAFT_2759668, partial [Pisolithus marmoratus]
MLIAILMFLDRAISWALAILWIDVSKQVRQQADMPAKHNQGCILMRAVVEFTYVKKWLHHETRYAGNEISGTARTSD